ncbi:TonB-dependent receptor [Bacteroides sp. 519]|nr:TonB-dependent receptor [Bacteroides sp. 519]
MLRNFRVFSTSILSAFTATFLLTHPVSVLANSGQNEISIQTPHQNTAKATGVIVDKNNEPIIGANVKVKGGSAGTITNLDGEFTVDAPVGSTLVISFIGYKSTEVVFNGSSLKVQLAEDSELLQEVVVVGYATVKKANLTGAVSAVDNKVIKDRPIINLGQGLQGVIPNLNVSTSGRPGEGSSFTIRGTGSISSGSGKPLVLIDGVEMDPNMINPQDIQNISVLKDAASASIYGSRAAFGVVLITTKDGRKNEAPKVTFDATISFNSPTTRPEYMNSMEYANWMNAANMTTNDKPYFDDEWMKHIRDYYENPSKSSPVFVHSDPTESSNGRKYTYAGNTDWMKEMYKTSYPIQQYNISINGGSEKVTYYTSAGLTDQSSLLRYGNESFKKFNLVNNISYDIAKWLKVGMKTSFNRTELSGLNQTRVHGDNFIGGDTRPIMPVKHPDGNWAGQGNFTNFAAILEDAGSRWTRKNDFWNTITARITPFAGASINFDYTFNFYSRVDKQHVKTLNEYGVDGQYLQVFPHTNPNGVYQYQADDTYNAVNLFADYEKTLGKHYLKGLVGFNQEEKHVRSFNAERRNLISNDIPSLSVATGDRYVGSNDNSWALRGAFLRLNYSFDDKYLIEVNGRYDLSSRFPKDDRAVFNPSASIGWRISNENFFKGARNIVDELKVRFSYGSLGNQSLDQYQPYLSNYSSAQLAWIMGSTQPQYVTPGGLVSSTLTWETVTQWDLGVDFALLQNRLKGTFDYYQRRTSDILMTGKQLPGILGTNEPMQNAAEILNKGWEVELSWNDVLPNGLYYSVGVNLSDYQAEVTKYDNPSGSFKDYYVGKKIGEIWGYKTAGLFQSTEEINSAPDHTLLNGKTPLPGDIRFEDLDGDKKIHWGEETIYKPGDQKIIGNSTPRYQYGFRGTAEWKNFDLSFFFQGVGKRDINLPQKLFLAHYDSQWQVPSKVNTDYWTEDNRNALFPRPRFDGGGWFNQTQTRFLQNGAYLRMKSLTLGYSIPKNILNQVGIEKLRVYFSGENLFTIKHTFEGFDPELTDPYKYPFQKSFAFGISLTL